MSEYSYFGVPVLSPLYVSLSHFFLQVNLPSDIHDIMLSKSQAPDVYQVRPVRLVRLTTRMLTFFFVLCRNGSVPAPSHVLRTC